MGRTPFYDKNGIKRGAWSEEEDAKLRAYVERYGHWNWRELPKFAGLKRCGKSCRLRWLNYLRPDVKRGNYTKEEEDSIIKLHEKLGSKWSVIASSLPGRTDNEIKNHWHTHLKKRVQRKAMRTSSTSNEQSSISECEANRENGSTTEPSNAHSDIASSQHSSEPRSIELSDCDHDIWRSMDLALEDSAGTSELFTEPCGSDFWSQPFLEDNSDKQNFGFASSLAFMEENGFSPSPYGMSYIDDQFSQWMPYMT